MQPPLDVKNIAALQEFVNSLQFHGDGINIDIDHNQAGIVFRFIGENNVNGQAAAQSEQTVRPAIILSGSAGAYSLSLLDDEGTVVEAGEGIATIATAYDLDSGDSAVAYKLKISTLGSN